MKKATFTTDNKMKITKSRLKRIIKEEVRAVLVEHSNAVLGDYFDTECQKQDFLTRVKEVGFDSASAEYDLGADTQIEIGKLLGHKWKLENY